MKKHILFFFICLNITSSFSQEKDTLFFNYDEHYLESYPRSPDLLYPKDIQGNEANLFLFKDEVYYDLDPKKILCLKEFLNARIFNDENNKNDGNKKINFDDLVDYLKKFELFLVKKEKKRVKFLKVIPGYEIY